jgi:hypothetical protein
MILETLTSSLLRLEVYFVCWHQWWQQEEVTAQNEPSKGFINSKKAVTEKERGLRLCWTDKTTKKIIYNTVNKVVNKKETYL